MALFSCNLSGSADNFCGIDIPTGNYLDLFSTSSDYKQVVTIPTTAVSAPQWQGGMFVFNVKDKSSVSVNCTTTTSPTFVYTIKTDGTIDMTLINSVTTQSISLTGYDYVVAMSTNSTVSYTFS